MLNETTKTIEIDVRPRRGSKPHCSACGNPARGYDTLSERRFELIPIRGFAVVLLYSMRRVECTTCGVKVEEVPGGRTEASFEKFFTLIGRELAVKIEFVCSDRWKPYLKLIAKHCTNALNILDRFHVVAKMNLAIDEVRAGETRRLLKDGYEPVLKKSRWCLLKRPENLTDSQRVKLSDVLRYNLQSVRAYLVAPAKSNSSLILAQFRCSPSLMFGDKVCISTQQPIG